MARSLSRLIALALADHAETASLHESLEIRPQAPLPGWAKSMCATFAASEESGYTQDPH